MIVVDVETTGLSPNKNSIVSIGAIDFFNPENKFYGECQIFPGTEISNQALEVNGFTREEITNSSKKSHNELITEFFNWVASVGNRKIAGENPSFDRNFLLIAAKRAGIPFQLGYRTIDLHALVYAEHLKKGINLRDKNLNLNYNLRFVGLPEEPNPHNALNGAKMAAEAISRIIYKKNLLKEFEKYTIK